MRMSPASLPRRALAEFTGTAALVAVVVGSGIRADSLSQDVGVRLLANALASAIGLGLLIALIGPLSGAHFNPVVTLSEWWSRRREDSGAGGDGGAARDGGREALAYIAAQLAGAVSGALLAEAMFGRAPGAALATEPRAQVHLLLGEAVATAGLVLVVQGLRRLGRLSLAPVAVAGYIGAAIWFTSSGSFANPAATVGRAFSDSFTGIAPGSVPAFAVAQLLGMVIGMGLSVLLYGHPLHGHPLPGHPPHGHPLHGHPPHGDPLHGTPPYGNDRAAGEPRPVERRRTE
ncbi:MIP/aquaporin family protein [Streptomyces roseicoloratus]|uniref:MIP/aquaporin family protein n=1 Tax=Streptomyces roseicoloratus TaxID=2508722 RepID=A0ABY9RZJ4_9ACTN|nr:MIP/aquaporin family protein [Streptomyces roseicoloratus]WMX47194.1 MIP/aquaporin family protein [Streptomyces roseicoloratus]